MSKITSLKIDFYYTGGYFSRNETAIETRITTDKVSF